MHALSADHARMCMSYLHPLAPQASYINYPDEDVAPNPMQAYYGPNLGWLQRVKRRFDPDEYFNTNALAIPAGRAEQGHWMHLQGAFS